MDSHSKERRPPISSNQSNLRVSLSLRKEKSREEHGEFHPLRDLWTSGRYGLTGLTCGTRGEECCGSWASLRLHRRGLQSIRWKTSSITPPLSPQVCRQS